MEKYILIDKIPVVEPDLNKWAEWTENNDKRIWRTLLKGDIMISTVFLGLDHSFLSGGDPVLFETMIFGGKHDEYQQRYCTWEEAERGHLKAVKLAKGFNIWDWIKGLFASK